MSKKTLIPVAAACMLAICGPWPAIADVQLASLFSDNMVLQRDQPLPIWGRANPGEKIDVTLAAQSARAVADADGRWQVRLPSLAAGGGPLELRVEGSSGSTIAVDNVLIGDVWLSTGPSNIHWALRRCDNAQREIASADYPAIRFFTVEKKRSDRPQTDCVGRWVACSPQTVADVSGIGYFFARRLHRELDVPIGLLQSYWGGSRMEAWTSREALEAEPRLKPVRDWWQNAIEEYDPEEPGAKDPRTSHHRPAVLYNAMIRPLAPYGLRGVICYQGLGNLFWGRYCHVLLPTMIGDWRDAWDRPELPIGLVQPAPFPCDRWPKSDPDAYSMLREAQLLTAASLASVGVAPTMDIGDVDELHFTNKQDVARRLSAWALAAVHGRELRFSGPTYESISVEGSQVRVHFTHAADGLVTAGRPPSHFTVAGSDHVFHPATAEIDGPTVVVQSPNVSQPVAVRFAWTDVSVPNLFNRAGLPASLFRSDGPVVPDATEK